MGKKLYEGRFDINRFYGGEKRGICIQITDENGYVQLTRKEIITLCNILRDFLIKTEKKIRD